MLKAIKQKASSFRLGSGPAPEAAAIQAVQPVSAVHEPSPAPQTIPRRVAQVVTEEHAIEGPGFEIARPFPTRSLRNFDPWLLFDAFGPVTLHPGDRRLVRHSHLGQHPHRGFEAITYHIAGQYDHYDSTGKHGQLKPGSVQLMTAGGGIVHGGAPTAEAAKNGTFLHGYQIWLALPAALRMCPARSLDLHADDTPVVTSSDGRVWARVIASSTPVYGATCTKLPTAVPVMMVHYVVQPGAAVRQSVPSDFNVMVHVSTGEGRFGPDLSTSASQEQCVFFERSLAQGGAAASLVEFCCPSGSSQPLDVLLLAGRPTGDKIVQYGPFVGGSMEDIHAAQADFQAGRMGSLAADGSPAPRSKWAVSS